MIVAMQEKATEEQIDAVIEAMAEAGVDVHRTTGESQTILAAVGSTASLDLSKFEVYPGVLESLEALKTLPDGSARKMAVLTNKPVGPAKAICDGLGLSPYFFGIYGGDSFPTKKPDPLGILALIEKAGVTPEETLMVGDSNVDIKTARNAGVWALGCTYGLSPETLEEEEPDAMVDHASAWTVALGAAEIKA